MFYRAPYFHRIAKYTTDLTREEVERSMHAALTMWSDAADLNFIKVDHDKADIVITFVSKGRFAHIQSTNL